jgi:hypothetical protein
LSHEVGFALLVAATIWTTFDWFSQAETDDQWTERIEKISKNVFFGVFKRNFPEEFIREANVLVLEQQFIRTGLHITYTISDESFANRQGVAQDFVKLNAIARFKVRNVANVSEKFPLGIALPNPLINEIKAVCKVNKIARKVGGKDVPYNLEAAEAKFREDIKDDKKFQVPFRLDDIDLAPNEEVELVFDYVMAKEDEDTEIFQTRYPADSVIVTVMDRGPTKRLVRARAIHLADFCGLMAQLPQADSESSPIFRQWANRLSFSHCVANVTGSKARLRTTNGRSKRRKPTLPMSRPVSGCLNCPATRPSFPPT